jgi:hypothetical protein
LLDQRKKSAKLRVISRSGEFAGPEQCSCTPDTKKVTIPNPELLVGYKIRPDFITPLKIPETMLTKMHKSYPAPAIMFYKLLE